MFKKTLALIISLICCIFLSSCDFISLVSNEPSEYDPSAWGSDDYPFAVETMEEIIRCLDEDDSESLKKLLSQEVLDRTETDDEIEEIMRFMTGNLLLMMILERE